MSSGHRKTQILKAAKSLFAVEGFEGVSVKEISEKAGVNIALISYYFNGKKELYNACLDGFGHESLAAAERFLALPESASELPMRLEAFANELLEVYLRDPEGTEIMQRECERGAPHVQKLFRTTFMRSFNQMVKVLAHAKRKKFLREDLDPNIGAILFYGLIMHWLRRTEIHRRFRKINIRNKAARLKIVKQTVQIFLQGALNPGSASKGGSR